MVILPSIIKNYILIKIKQGDTIFKILILIFSFTLANAVELKITTDNWFPYTSEVMDNKGIVTEIVHVVLNKQKYELDFNSFHDGYFATKNNKYIATFPYFKTKQREKEMLYSDELLKVKNVIFYNKNKFNENNINNIYGYTIGIVKGYEYKNIDISKFKNIKSFESELIAFEMLNKGLIELLPSNKLTGIHIIKKYYNDFYSSIDIIKNKKYISVDTMHLIVKKNTQNQKFIKKFNNSLKEIKRNGKYHKVLLLNRKYLEPNISNFVKLVNNTEAFPMVTATLKRDSVKKFMIPRGTKAIVLQWSKHFIKEGNIKIFDEMFKKTKVKIINGPLKGKILFVDNMFIEIE